MNRISRIAILGAECSGKSTLAAALAHRFQTVWVEEAARRLWTQAGGHFSFEDMLRVAKVQISDEEEMLAEAKRLLFVDTTPLTTLIYSLDLYGKADAELEALSHRSYDLTMLCAPDFPFVQDGLRTDAVYRQKLHLVHLALLNERGIPFTPLSGNLSERLAQATAAIYRRWPVT